MRLRKSATKCVCSLSASRTTKGEVYHRGESLGVAHSGFLVVLPLHQCPYSLTSALGRHPLRLLWCPQCSCASEHWTGMTFQQEAIYGTWVLSNNQICLWSRATALGHSAIFTAINFSIYTFLLGVVTLWTILSPASWEQYSWTLMGITEWCLISKLSRGTTVRHCLHPIQHSNKRPADFSIPFLF